MIIDAHTHWGIVWEDKYKNDPSEWLRICDKHGVDMAVLMGHRGLGVNSDIKRCNDIIKETAERSNGRLIPIATVHPDFGEKSTRELERCLKDLDMRGLKLHPWLQGFSLSTPIMDELSQMCARFDVPVIFHDGTPCYSMPSQVGGLALRCPGTKFVLGHSGLLDLWRDALSFGKRCSNLFLTLCGPYQSAMREIIDSIDENLILWGTDFGFGWSDPIGYRKGIVDDISMPERKRSMIMGLNAAKLFKVNM